MIRDDLKALLAEGVDALRRDGVVDVETPSIQLERPTRNEHGQFSTNLALVLAKDAGMSPRQLAEALLPKIPHSPLVTKTEIAGPGFINFYLSDDWLHATITDIAKAKLAYGHANTGADIRISVEFVSANPTGPLHAGAGRNAALGHALANLLEAVGHTVWREYYVNDTGKQLERFARSIEARYRQALGHDVRVPEDGYHGNYLIEMGRKLADAEAMGMIGKLAEITEWALQESIASHRTTLERFGVHFDEWFSEKSLHESGAVQAAVDQLTEGGHTFESEGALWFRSSDAGGTRDQVLVRSNGTPTYLAADIAYLLNKCERGFDKALYLWGADHHGNVESLISAARLVGATDVVEVLVYQLVNLFENGQQVRMSKRTGEMVTLDELIDEVGVDAARYTLLTRSIDSPIDFDFDLVKSQSQDNPVYYIQYAHARNHSILRYANESGITLKPIEEVELTRLVHESEHALIRKLNEYPDLISEAAKLRAPYRLTTYLQVLAGLFNGGFYRDCRVITEDSELTQARLWLVEATRQVMANALGILGVYAPDRM